MKIANYTQKVEMPSGVTCKAESNLVTIKGPLGEVKKQFKMPAIKIKSEGNSIVIGCDKCGSYEKEKIFTVMAHLKNMIHGSQKGYVYLLKVCSSHFPMTVAVQGNKLVVKNLYGEKVPRELELTAGAKVSIKGEIVEVTGQDKEIVSQTAADIEMLTRTVNKDRRVFQDGIYITHKDGQKIE